LWAAAEKLPERIIENGLAGRISKQEDCSAGISYRLIRKRLRIEASLEFLERAGLNGSEVPDVLLESRETAVLNHAHQFFHRGLSVEAIPDSELEEGDSQQQGTECGSEGCGFEEEPTHSKSNQIFLRSGPELSVGISEEEVAIEGGGEISGFRLIGVDSVASSESGERAALWSGGERGFDPAADGGDEEVMCELNMDFRLITSGKQGCLYAGDELEFCVKQLNKVVEFLGLQQESADLLQWREGLQSAADINARGGQESFEEQECWFAEGSLSFGSCVSGELLFEESHTNPGSPALSLQFFEGPLLIPKQFSEDRDSDGNNTSISSKMFSGLLEESMVLFGPCCAVLRQPLMVLAEVSKHLSGV
jgi:hypothetical protein